MDRLSYLQRLARGETITDAPKPADAFQRPGILYVPGLSAKGWHDPAGEFPWVKMLEAGYPTIRAELDAYNANAANTFQGYVTPGNKPFWTGQWDALYFEAYGKVYEETCAQFPETWKLLQQIPRRTGTTFFSSLEPGTHIRPHHGISNTKLVCHLGMIIPPGCAFRVGDEVRTWHEGKMLVFDDSYEHEVWHRGDKTRVALLFEVQHPELSDEEIAIIERMQASTFAKSIAELHRMVDEARAKK